jgi:hypothetical protein
MAVLGEDRPTQEGTVYSSETKLTAQQFEQKAWIAAPLVVISVNPGDSTIITTILTGWRPDASSGLCGLDQPAPLINVSIFKNGVLTYGANGLSAQSEIAVTTTTMAMPVGLYRVRIQRQCQVAWAPQVQLLI